jgi:DNA-binding XRE family transcriptional regulator
MDVVLVKNANRMMTTATLLDDGIELSFADGLKGLIPYAEVPEVKTREAISGLELPNPYEMVLQTAGGESVEIPWDFARHHCDPTYRPLIEAQARQARESLGGRIRERREAAGLTQAELSSRAGVGRATLTRIEKGEHSPRTETLTAIARALEVEVADLILPAARRNR